jgi:hypothetical protein
MRWVLISMLYFAAWTTCYAYSVHPAFAASSADSQAATMIMPAYYCSVLLAAILLIVLTLGVNFLAYGLADPIVANTPYHITCLGMHNALASSKTVFARFPETPILARAFVSLSKLVQSTKRC